MVNLNLVHQIYHYLCDVYEQTKSNYIKSKLIKTYDENGLTPRMLHKHKFLIEHNNCYKWKMEVPPTFQDAYNYYYAVRGKKKTYNQLLTVLDSPNTYSVKELIEAISVKAIVDNTAPIIFETKPIRLHEEIEEINTIAEQSTSTLKECLEKNSQQPDIPNPLLTKFDTFLVTAKDIKEIMFDIVNNTIDNTTAVKNVQSSTSTVIAILKTIQENIFDLTISQYFIIREQYAFLKERIAELTEDNPKYAEYTDRLNKIGTAQLKLRERVDANIAIVNKYGNHKR